MVGPLVFTTARSRRIRGVLAIALLFLLGALLASEVGCAGPDRGRYHTVAQGENLYRIGLRYGVDAKSLARVNRIRDVTQVKVGERIWIPPSRSSARARRPAESSSSSRNGTSSRHPSSEAVRSGLNFIWPLETTTITSRFGRRNGRPHQGIDLRGRSGTRIRAAEAGKVIHSGWLGDYGKVVIVKHRGHYRTVYAHASKLHVKRGQFVDRGQRIAEVGSTGRSTGPHLHFEVRYGESPRDPMQYLP
ncbi:MAG: LysM peptidoglycan-binding domain-containing M23 family metallopeptidase [Myxococcota bacterium]|nr:LysM peptidoglycan-binding domain-containing M23 family metallopeptidase [Myxococcota bacterium]